MFRITGWYASHGVIHGSLGEEGGGPTRKQSSGTWHTYNIIAGAYNETTVVGELCYLDE